MAMTRTEVILKWVAYGIALTLAALTQFYILGPILAPTVPLLIPMAVAALATLEGGPSGAVFGMAAGLVQYTLSHTSLVWAAALSVMGWLVGVLAQHVLRQDHVGFVICGLLSLIAIEGVQVLSRLLGEVAGWRPLLMVAGQEAFWTAALSAPVYWLFLFCCRRYGRIQYE